MPLNTAPTKSLDFGLGGITGSVSRWHELLQMTAPDAECGVVFVRGHFPDNADAILARAQRRNQTGTFGLELKIEEDSEYVLENTSAQGMINLRWPYNRFNLVWAERDRPLQRQSFASQTSCSFVRNQTLYQIIRVTPDKFLESRPVSETESEATGNLPSLCDVTLQVGGVIRFGCYSGSCINQTNTPSVRNSNVNTGLLDRLTFGGPNPAFRDEYKVIGPKNGGSEYVLTLLSTNYELRLEIRVWVNRKRVKLVQQRPTLEGEPGSPLKEFESLYAHHRLKLYQNCPLNIVATFSLVSSSKAIADINNQISDNEVMMHLGVADISRAASYRLWAAVLGEVPGPKSPNAFKLNAIGRCIEEVIGVLAIPIQIKIPEIPGNHSAEGSASTSQGRNSGSKVREEKVKDYGIALIQNVMSKQVVDLESML
jgi:hypothetical protein